MSRFCRLGQGAANTEIGCQDLANNKAALMQLVLLDAKIRQTVWNRFRGSAHQVLLPDRNHSYKHLLDNFRRTRVTALASFGWTLADCYPVSAHGECVSGMLRL